MIVMCVAEELGLPVGEVAINTLVDTDSTPFDRGNYGSRGTIQQGNAAVAAARDVRQQLFEVVADKLGSLLTTLKLRTGKFSLRHLQRRECLSGRAGHGLTRLLAKGYPW